MAETGTRILETVGAVLRYDVRPGSGADPRPLLLISSHLDATGFTTLASHFGDRTVVTYDPRGIGRSTCADGAAAILPEEHADDLARLIEALGAGPVDVFASSGGAVNALALVAARGELVHTLVAHEPPTAAVLPDREAVLGLCADVHTTYLRDGWGPAMAKFIVLTGREGPFPEEWAEEPAPDPAAFGLSTEDDGTRDDPLFGRNLLGCTSYRPDFAALRSAPTRIVLARGRESEGMFAARAAVAVAEGLGTPPVVFPGHRAGFLGGEYGQQGVPAEFAETLRGVLAGE
ncbi:MULTISPECIES: alpha/beta fold hydrolase [unclassified Streptomyces]|uniref:alpha/beta fold hydrolase n=1 Tax=unclassified Streptomyces TaxID=2593676 RepID=UPI001661051B|nr:MULTISPECIES: alpha/beta hydrolase [unclassified Streptomyces]MBD0709062.1 alpha/beta hydrolase [Streptomyces sp. CBMA291]MBD0716212.1 alpha/beta hydrolase [Streptomyces sp. CBMA370]